MAWLVVQLFYLGACKTKRSGSAKKGQLGKLPELKDNGNRVATTIAGCKVQPRRELSLCNKSTCDTGRQVLGPCFASVP